MERRIKVSNENTKIIENATRDDIQTGDHVTWEYTGERDGVTTFERREGIAHHRNRNGDWCTEEGRYITYSEGYGRTITIRRAAKTLPDKMNSVIVPSDGHKRIEAVMNGKTWYAREAVLGAYGLWVAAWRTDTDSIPVVKSEEITEGTWKEDTE